MKISQSVADRFWFSWMKGGRGKEEGIDDEEKKERRGRIEKDGKEGEVWLEPEPEPEERFIGVFREGDISAAEETVCLSASLPDCLTARLLVSVFLRNQNDWNSKV